MSTKTTSAVIIDDEIDGRNIVAYLLNRFFPDVTLLGQAENVADGTDLIRATQPDVVFLDVEMPDGNAFDLLTSVTGWEGQIILITAHDHYAIKAIKASILDYLLKPVDEEEFTDAVTKALKKSAASQPADQTGLLLEIRKSLMARKVRIPTVNGFTLANVDDLVRCEASGNYTKLFFIQGKKIIASRKLGVYEQELKGYGFIRVHNKHLINTRHIIEYTKGKNSGGFIALTGNETVEVSARRKGDILAWLG
jgi:two-component system LytT family response regulator